jgi:hypothetical protein
MESKQVVAESLFANGLYGYWCAECDKEERIQDEIYKLNKKLTAIQEQETNKLNAKLTAIKKG